MIYTLLHAVEPPVKGFFPLRIRHLQTMVFESTSTASAGKNRLSMTILDAPENKSDGVKQGVYGG